VQREKETADRKLILPIWHNINEEEVRNFYPALTLRNKIPYDLPMNAIVVAIETGTVTAQKAREVGDPLRKEYSELADALADHDANERLSHTEQGVRKGLQLSDQPVPESHACVGLIIAAFLR